jgi:hypothetical protein
MHTRIFTLHLDWSFIGHRETEKVRSRKHAKKRKAESHPGFLSGSDQRPRLSGRTGKYIPRGGKTEWIFNPEFAGGFAMAPEANEKRDAKSVSFDLIPDAARL